MPTWKIRLEYDGTRYAGWQEQKNARTVAGDLRNAAEGFLANPVEIVGAGRTDAGVHALGQVARMRSIARAKEGALLIGLNDRLPPDINVLEAEETRSQFDPRRDALARYYIYQIATRRTAFAKRFVWWVKDRLDYELMRKASESLVGRHDFARFSEARGDDRSTVVVVGRVELAIEGDLLLFRIGATHFLWKMVRRIVGSLVEVGRGRLSAEEFKGLVDGPQSAKGRTEFHVASHTAPPSGLFLERVVYEKTNNIPPLKPPFAIWRSDQ